MGLQTGTQLCATSAGGGRRGERSRLFLMRPCPLGLGLDPEPPFAKTIESRTQSEESGTSMPDREFHPTSDA
jgi:hypothetical protein